MTAPRPLRSLLVSAAVAAAVACAWYATCSPVTFVLSLAATWAGSWVIGAAWWPAPRRVLVMRLVAAHLAIVVLVLVLEVPALLELADYRLVLGTPILAPSRDPRYVADRELICLPHPREHRSGDDGRGDIAFLFDVPDRVPHAFDVLCDDRGFRNPVTLEHADVAVVGDSFVAADYVFQGHVATEVLANRLHVSVCNLGQRGYGPQQEAAVVRRYALPLHPRVVVWMFYEGNDLEDIYAYRAIAADPEAARAARHGFAARSFTRNSLESLMFFVGNPRASALPRSAWWTAAGRRERLYFLYPCGPLDQRRLSALDDLRGILADTAKRCAEAGAHFVVAFAPDKFRVTRDHLEFEEGAETAGWSVDDLPARLAEITRGLPAGASFVDLTPALKARCDAGDIPYFRDDTHWNVAGNRIAAETLAGVVGPLLAKPVQALAHTAAPEKPR